MNDEVLDAVKIGIEYILLTVFVFFAIKAMQLRDNYAIEMNTRQELEQAAEDKMTYSLYNTETSLPADEVLAAIRNFSDEGISIYVDDMGNGSDMLWSHAMIQSVNKKDKEKCSQKWIANHLTMTNYYKPYIVYDNVDPKEYAQKIKTGNVNRKMLKGEFVSGIIFLIDKTS
ncbi:hypothetical protein SAMN05216391_10994 [Lachnospiraceae bacterium KHCPX20]|nr:hypothetical protein SAMN05216391_10994 [Lachnospiraceae bacterium KHCPX20]